MARAEITLWSSALLLLGVLAGGEKLSFLAFCALSVLILGGALAWKRRSAPEMGPRYAFLLLPLLLGFFYIRFHFAWTEVSRKLPPPGAETAALVIGEASRAGESWIVPADLRDPYRGEVRLRVRTEFAYGDALTFRTGGGSDAEPGRPPLISAPDAHTLATGQGAWLKSRLLDIKMAALGKFKAYLPADQAALLGGLTLGARSDFSPELKEAMRRSGTTHLVALSGYNIAILVMALMAALKGLVPRRAAFLLLLAAISGFVLMTGGEASIVRAALMGLLALAAAEAGRSYSFGHALALSAVLMSLHEPTLLRFDLGFQLSFLSLLGVAYLSEPVAVFLRLAPGPEDFLSWKGNLATTCAAQLAVLPLLLKSFGSFPLAAVPANVLILGLVPFTMFLGFLTFLLGSLSFFLGQVGAWAAHMFLSYELGVVELFARMPWEVGDFLPGWLGLGLYYLALLYFGLRYLPAIKKYPAHAL